MSDDQPLPTSELPVTANPWASLRRFTDARIGLGRSGISIPTQHLLEFQLAHAKAQDAVYKPLDVANLTARLKAESVLYRHEPISLHSAANDRTVYLQRPDFGRRLDEVSRQCLLDHRNQHDSEWDLVIAIVDGLSAFAIEENAVPFLQRLLPALQSQNDPWSIAPLCIVQQGRVAIGDMIGEQLGGRCVLVLIGERPGLSSPNSMGLYLTWAPAIGKTDAERNCISNIRPAGLSYEEAARRALYLLGEARRKKLTGVGLKDRLDDSLLASTHLNLPENDGGLT